MLELLICPLIAFSQLSTVDGLSQNTVFSVANDSSKNMWFATYNGINCYDGYNFFVYHLDSDPNFVRAAGADPFVFVDSKDNVWGYDRGLGVFDKRSGTFVLCKDILSGPVSDIMEAADGNIMIVSGGEIKEIDSDTNALASDTPFYPYNDVSKIHCKDGIIALGTIDGRLLLYRADNYTLISEQKLTTSVGEGKISDVYVKSASEVWALLSGVAIKLNISTMSAKSYQCYHNGLKQLPFQIVPDNSGDIYLVASSSLYKYDTQYDKFTQACNNSFPKMVRGACFDSDNGVWLGTYRNGVYYACLDEIPLHPIDLGIPEDELSICSISEGFDNNLWISTQEHGMLIYNPFTKRAEKLHRECESLKYGVMSTVFDEKRQKVYFGNSKGITIYNLSTKKFANIDSYESHPIQVYSLVREDSSRWWVGTLSGLYIFDADAEILTEVPGTNNLFIYNLYRDNDSYLWIATIEGLFKTTIKQSAGTIPQCGGLEKCSEALDVHDITRVGNYLYVAARNGLFVLDSSGTYRHYTTTEGLSSNYLNGIEADSYGRVWIGTEYGLNCLDPRTDKITRIYKVDGSNVDYYSKNSHCRTSSGNIYFGGEGGVSYIDSKLPQPDLSSFMPRITAVLANGVKLNLDGRPLLLKHSQNNLRFRFAVPNYSSKGKSIFHYRLVGLDNEWHSTSSENSVGYSSLRPGTYRFELYSTNKNSKPSPKILTIDIRISKPWYSSLLAQLLYIIVFAIGMYYAIHVLIKRNVKMTKAEIEEIKMRSKAEIDKLRVFNITGRMCSPEEVTFIVKMLDIIEANISNSSFSVEQLASEMCMSRSNLFLLVKEAIGDSASHIIRIVRFNKACQLLTETDMTIEEIALETGYSSGASFSASFKKEKNMSPMEWRK